MGQASDMQSAGPGTTSAYDSSRLALGRRRYHEPLRPTKAPGEALSNWQRLILF